MVKSSVWEELRHANVYNVRWNLEKHPTVIRLDDIYGPIWDRELILEPALRRDMIELLS